LVDVGAGPTPLTANFSGGCTDSDGTCVSYLWDFGDGSQKSSQQNPSHTYTTTGTFTAILTVKDDDGVIGQSSQTVTVAIQYGKTFGGVLDDGANSVQQTTDGGYIVAGVISSYAQGQMMLGY